MQDSVLKHIEQILQEKVRPSLGEHSGDVAIQSYQDGVLKVRLLGKCSGCPSASLTMESIVAKEVKEAVSEVRDVILVAGVSDELWEMARGILKHKGTRPGDTLDS